MHFDNFGSLCAPILVLIFSLGIYVELVQEGLDITLVLDSHKSSLEVLIEGQILFYFSLSWFLSAYPTYLCRSGPVPVIFWLVADPLSLSSAVFIVTPIFHSVLSFF